MRKQMFDFYTSRAGAHKYIAGFRLKGRVIAVVCDAATIYEGIKLDKASRGAGYSLRFKPNFDAKLTMMTCGEQMFKLCSTDFFDAEVKASKYNKGEVFEKMITEHFGQTWTKDNIAFTEQGDINIKGIEYQIKFENATFITEKQMMRMRAEG